MKYFLSKLFTRDTGSKNNLPAIANTKTFFMKKLFTLCLLLPFTLMAQNIYTVSNVPGTISNYKTLQGAHDSVAAGSILYVLPGSFSYGDVVLTKKLTIYGTGYFLGQNLEPNTQANTAPVILNSIKFRSGSDNSYVEGLQLTENSVVAVQRIEIDTASNITISRCRIIQPNAFNSNYFVFKGANNCLVKECYIDNTSTYWIGQSIIYGPNATYSFTGILFTNNIIDWRIIGATAFNINNAGTGSFAGVANATFANNTFYVSLFNSSFGNLNYTNNIFVHDVIDAVQGSGLPSQLNGTNLNNITNIAAMFTPVGTNLNSVNTDSLFVNTLPGYHSKDQSWMLRDIGFANTFGTGGIAVGAYGGSNPYKLSGIPNQPYIYNLTVPAQATAPGTLIVHIKAKASN